MFRTDVSAGAVAVRRSHAGWSQGSYPLPCWFQHCRQTAGRYTQSCSVLWIRNYFFRIRITFSAEFWIRIQKNSYGSGSY
jgi:hypothetical protein